MNPALELAKALGLVDSQGVPPNKGKLEVSSEPPGGATKQGSAGVSSLNNEGLASFDFSFSMAFCL